DDLVQGDGLPDIVDLDGNSYPIHHINGATIKVGAPCSADTDVQASMATVSAPAGAQLGQAFDVVAGGTIVNNGPTSPANTDAKVILNTPTDCSAAGGS